MSWQHSAWPKEMHQTILELAIASNGDDGAPEWAMDADLVFHADAANHPKRPEPFPGRRELQARWKVSERVARKALASPGWQEKCDALGIPRPTRHLKGHDVPVTAPETSPSPSPSTSPSLTDKSSQPTRTVPVAVPAPAPETSPSMSTRAEIPPLLLSSSPPEQKREAADPPTLVDQTPPWARGWRGNPAVAVADAVVRSLSAIREQPVSPKRCHGDARLFSALWRAQGCPTIGDLADEVELVARWAREGDTAENDIRGVDAKGVRWTADRSRTVRTLLDPEKFGDRLISAQRWQTAPASRKVTAKSAHDWTPPPATGPPPDAASVDADMADIAARAAKQAADEEAAMRRRFESKQPRRQAVPR